jgi:hypothetical protein
MYELLHTFGFFGKKSQMGGSPRTDAELWRPTPRRVREYSARCSLATEVIE